MRVPFLVHDNIQNGCDVECFVAGFWYVQLTFERLLLHTNWQIMAPDMVALVIREELLR